MALPRDFEGEPPEMLSSGDGDIVGPAGQKVGTAGKPASEQIAAWGGFREGETETNETEEKSVPMRVVEDRQD